MSEKICGMIMKNAITCLSLGGKVVYLLRKGLSVHTGNFTTEL